jgi:hypothetical protein
MIQRLIVILLAVYLSAVVFAPPIPGNEWLRYDDIILLFAAAVAVLPRLKSRSPKSSSSGHVIMILVFVYLILLTILFSSLLAGFSYNYNYNGLVKELLRLGKYILVVFLALSIVERSHRRIVTYWIVGLAILVVVTQIAQYFGSVHFNQSFAQFYGDLHHFDIAIFAGSRERGIFYAGGPFANPNVASSFLIIPLLYLMPQGFIRNQDKKLYSYKERMLFFAITLVLFAGILLTDTRAAMIAVLIAASFYLLIGQTGKGRIAGLFVVIVPLVLFMLIAQTLLIKEPFVDHIMNAFTGGSMSVKMMAFQNGLSQLSDSGYWWGYGADSGPHVDFEIALLIMWYGLPGIFVFSLFYLGMMWAVLKHKETFDEWQAIFAIIMTSSLMNLSQSTYLTVRVFPIFIVFILMNFSAGMLEREKKTSHPSTMQTSVDMVSR